jgi:hypothetical protein
MKAKRQSPFTLVHSAFRRGTLKPAVLRRAAAAKLEAPIAGDEEALRAVANAAHLGSTSGWREQAQGLARQVKVNLADKLEMKESVARLFA